MCCHGSGALLGYARSHTEGPADDESIPRKLEGWWRVMEFRRDADTEASQNPHGSLRCDEHSCERLQAGQDLDVGELCFLEKLWTDRIRIFKASRQRLACRLAGLTRRCWCNLPAQAGHKGPAGEIPLSRVRLSQWVMSYIVPLTMPADGRNLFEVCDLQLTSTADTSTGSRPVRNTHAQRTAHASFPDVYSHHLPVSHPKSFRLCNMGQYP